MEEFLLFSAWGGSGSHSRCRSAPGRSGCHSRWRLPFMAFSAKLRKQSCPSPENISVMGNKCSSLWFSGGRKLSQPSSVFLLPLTDTALLPDMPVGCHCAGPCDAPGLSAPWPHSHQGPPASPALPRWGQSQAPWGCRSHARGSDISASGCFS